jgi:hypothetical protein
MKSQLFTVAMIMLLAAQCACMAVNGGDAVKAETSAAANKEAFGDEAIADYKHWTRVNPVPAVFEANVATLCAAPMLGVVKNDPHRDKFLTVFVNEIGRKSMMEDKSPHFPQGSIIVKEKLTAKDSTSPELLTVMMKRQAGFNPENGDWEYLVFDGSGKQVQTRGRLDNCQACHTMVAHTDFVYRSYLPAELRAKLR